MWQGRAMTTMGTSSNIHDKGTGSRGRPEPRQPVGPLDASPAGGIVSAGRQEPERIDILGVPVSVVDMDAAIQVIDDWVASRERHYVCVRDVHGVMLCRNDPNLQRIHSQAGLVTPDGMPLVWVGRLRGYHRIQRVCGADLMSELCKQSLMKGYRHFFYGGAPSVVERLIRNLHHALPGLNVVGWYSPPFRALSDEEDEQVVQTINESGAQIVWVGLGTPKQEAWMAAHLGRIEAPVLVGVGAAFDFHAGVVRRAPLWMQRGGLEWAFRLASEPRRLWRRYLTVVPLFVPLALLQALGLKRSSLDG